jgi:nucleoside 2-deoxyribosyltransferase
MTKRVYLAGPISGLNYEGAEGWRKYVKSQIETGAKYPVQALSPLRAQEHLRDVGIFTDHAKETERLACPMSTPRGLFVRDRYDAMNCDVLFVNLLGATKESKGTILELGWADSKGTPIVVAIENDGSNPHEHAMINELIGFRCTSLDQAINVTKSILGI